MAKKREKDTNIIRMTLRLRREYVNEERIMKILENHREYGYSSMTQLVVAALVEYKKNHPLDADAEVKTSNEPENTKIF